MLSLFIIYSPDRAKPLDFTISLLKEMDGYSKWQKTLVIDGKADRIYNDFDVIQVPRINGKFCWAKMWDAGVYSAKNDLIWYLDSDRLLPNNYASLIQRNIKENAFLFTSKHYMMLRELSLEDSKYWTDISEEKFFESTKYFGKLKFEPRFKNAINEPGKNVMSGNTAFLKNTYLKLGGVDHWYCGHGAFADTDFHMHASKQGCEFIDLNIKEIHYFHEKDVTKKEFDEMTVCNYVYFCKKWNLPKILVENLVSKTELPSEFADRAWNVKFN